MCVRQVGIDLGDKISELWGLIGQIKTAEKQLILWAFLQMVRFIEKGQWNKLTAAWHFLSLCQM
jgi:hypothetical protein